MKKSKKNRYAGSQPEERYGLGTRKSLYLDRPTSHGGWPEGEYDPPINDRIYDYLKSMGLVQEAHLRKVIRDILNEVRLDPPVTGKIFKTPEQKTEPLTGVQLDIERDLSISLTMISLSAIRYFGLSLIDVWLEFTEQIVTGKLQTKTIEFINWSLPKLVEALIKKGLTEEEAKREAADRVIKRCLRELHDLFNMWGVLFDPVDIINGLIYLYEDDKISAALSFTFAAPIIKRMIKNKKFLLAPNDPLIPVIVGVLGKITNALNILPVPETLKDAMEEDIEDIKKSIITIGVNFAPLFEDPEKRKQRQEVEKLSKLLSTVNWSETNDLSNK